MMTTESLAETICAAALNFGYDDCGIISVADLDGYGAYLAERKEKIPRGGKFYDVLDPFTHLREDYPWAKSVIICSIWMGRYRYPPSLQGKYGKAFFLSADAVPDSPAHRNKLSFEAWMAGQGIRFAGGETNAPTRLLPLRYAAVAAGMGIFRKNNFFYGEKGSYYELEGYLIDKDCEYKRQCTLRPCADSCTLCQKACRTHALSAPYTMDPLSCISFWTTFGLGQIPPYLTEDQFAAWLCGCDACQDACPYNKAIDWNSGETIPELEAAEGIMAPEQLIHSSDDVLREKIIPLTVGHIAPDQAYVLKDSAARVLRYEKAHQD